MNNTDAPYNYLATIEHFRQEELSDRNQIHAPEFIPSNSKEPVDYLAASKAWELAQAGKYTIYTTEQEDEGRL